MSRLSPQAREAEIVEAAAGYFAEAGFGGTTRELARRIGVSQALLYRYFPTKDALIDRVYEAVFGRTWQAEWDPLLDGAGDYGSVDERLVVFYRSYAAAVLEERWIRLFLLSGQRGYDYPGRWVRMLRGRVFNRVIGLVRADLRLAPRPPTEAEFEAVWGLHGSLVYLGVRRSLFAMRMPLPMDRLVEQQVRLFLAGLRSLLGTASAPAEIVVA